MARASDGRPRRVAIGLAALALLAGCGQPVRHNEAENEFTAWANDVERESANEQASPDFEEPANIMERALPARPR